MRGAGTDVSPPPPIDENDDRANASGRIATSLAGAALGPAEDGAIGICRIGRRGHDDLSSVGLILQRSQEIPCSRQRKLRGPDPAGEIASSNSAGVLERLQYVIHGAEAPRDPF